MTPERVRILRRVLRGLAIAGVILAVLSVRVVTASRAELITADHLRAKKDLDAAIVHYRRAARWYAPGNPYVEAALAHLARIGADAEHAGDTERALSAWRAVRSAIMSTRSFYTPHTDRLHHADERIAALMASLPPPPIDAGKSKAELAREHLALLEAPSRPRLGWTLLLLFGFAAWVSGAFVFLRRAIDEEDRLVPAEARRWGTVIILGFGLFVLGMALA